ncbi:MAG: Ribosomal silencing factor RsfS [Nitrospira sp.]|nr:Ribosomal silencing factor RsfS [Nitrospira sp.]
MLDLRGHVTFTDYFIICTGANERHLDALAEALDRDLGKVGVKLNHQEGEPASGWILQDFGDVIVHLFSIEARERYGLEQLWKSATPVVRLP